jgi:citrate synthase
MSSEQRPQAIRTRIWREEPEAENSFATRAAYCHGYDVYGEMVGSARWSEMLYLLFRSEAPTAQQTELLEALAVALANAGPRDPAVHAAMCGGVGGSTAASCLIAALAVGAGQLSGAREVRAAMEVWAACGRDLAAWEAWLERPRAHVASIWPEAEHPPGFDPHATRAPGVVCQALATLASLSPAEQLPWLLACRSELEALVGRGLALSGVAAAALGDLGFTPPQGEMLHLLLRLPGAAAHALEQQELGHKAFPFYVLELEGDPALEQLARREAA